MGGRDPAVRSEELWEEVGGVWEGPAVGRPNTRQAPTHSSLEDFWALKKPVHVRKYIP